MKDVLDVLRERLGERKPSFLARKLNDDYGLYHDASYYTHALQGSFRLPPAELRAVGQILGLDLVWAFEGMGYPQLAERDDDDTLLPELRSFLMGVNRDQQRLLLETLPQVLEMQTRVLVAVGVNPFNGLRQTEDGHPLQDGDSHNVNQPTPDSVGDVIARKNVSGVLHQHNKKEQGGKDASTPEGPGIIKEGTSLEPPHFRGAPRSDDSVGHPERGSKGSGG